MSNFFAELKRRHVARAGAICAAMVCLGSEAQSATNAIPDFAVNDHISWNPVGQKGDNFLPPRGGGPGPIMSPPDHPYIPNGGNDFASSHPTYRVADLSNPILLSPGRKPP